MARCFVQPLDVTTAGLSLPSTQALRSVGDTRKLEGIVDGRWLLPSTGFIETICRAFHLHPFDAFLTAQDLFRHSGGIARKVCGDYLAREVLVELLGQLGHRWWSQSEVSEGKYRDKLSYDEVYQIAERRVSESWCVEVSDLFGGQLVGWVRGTLIGFNNSCFFGESPLVFDLDGEGFRSVQRAGV